MPDDAQRPVAGSIARDEDVLTTGHRVTRQTAAVDLRRYPRAAGARFLGVFARNNVLALAPEHLRSDA